MGFSEAPMPWNSRKFQVSRIRNSVVFSWLETPETEIRRNIKSMNKESFAACVENLFIFRLTIVNRDLCKNFADFSSCSKMFHLQTRISTSSFESFEALQNFESFRSLTKFREFRSLTKFREFRSLTKFREFSKPYKVSRVSKPHKVSDSSFEKFKNQSRTYP